MIKEWATVVSWQNGIALVSCDVKASCNSCASRAGCGSRVLNKLGPQTSHTISVPSEQPLVAGQKVELGIAEGSLLSSAMLVYLSPLVGLFVMGGLFQMLCRAGGRGRILACQRSLAEARRARRVAACHSQRRAGARPASC